MCKRGKLGWHAFISRRSVSSLFIVSIINLISAMALPLYADEIPFGDSMATAVIRSNKENLAREVRRAERTYGTGVLVKDLTLRETVPFTIDIIDPGNDGDVNTLGDEDGDNRTYLNPFINGFDLRNANVSFPTLDRIEIFINLAKTDNNGFCPTQVGSTSADPCYGGAFTQNAWAFNADPTAETDYFGWSRPGCILTPSLPVNIIDGDTNPCADANTDRTEPDEGAAFGACAGTGANPTAEFYIVDIEQPIGTLKIRVRITGRTGALDVGHEAIAAVGDLLPADLQLEGGTNTFDYDTNLRNTIHLTILNANDPLRANFNPEGSFLIRLFASSVIDGPGEDNTIGPDITTTSTTTTSTTCTDCPPRTVPVPAVTHPRGTIIYGILLMAAGIFYMLWRRRR